MSECPDLLQLEQVRVASQEADPQVASHVATCARCRGQLQDLRADAEVLAQVRGLREFNSQTVHLPLDFQAAVPGYRLLQEIRRGGQGLVFRARQESTGRDVALKVIHAPARSPVARLRFEREITAASRLNHPNVVTVFDGGTAGGILFLAMELVEGESLEAWIQARAPAVEERLRLMAKVCEAVQHAHQRGVIHRDLKPANILVEADGEPRVLDFGLAKVLDEIVDEPALLRTQPGEFLGTLAFASPEQVRGNPDLVDVRSDVYSLGVLLCFVLTGRLPYSRADSIRGMVEAVAERPPIPLRTLSPGLDRDLEAVANRALAKGPAERYQAAGTLAADLRRYLAKEPVEARGESLTYLLRKALRRHRLVASVILAFAVVLMVSAGAVFSLWRQSERDRQRAEGARELAERKAARSDAITLFLRRSLGQVAPEEAGREALVVDWLKQVAKDAEVDLAARPVELAAVLDMTGMAYWSLGLLEEAERHLRKVWELSQLHLGPADADTVAAEGNLGHLLSDMGDAPQAEPLLRRAVEAGSRLPGDSSRLLSDLNNLAVLLWREDRLDEAEPLMRQVLEKREAKASPGEAELLTARHNLACLLIKRGVFDEAEPVLGQNLKDRREHLGDRHPDTLTSFVVLAHLLEVSGRPAEACALLEEMWRAARAAQGLQSRPAASGLARLARLREEAGDLAGAIEVLRVLIAVQGELPGLPPEAREEAGAKLAQLQERSQARSGGAPVR